jgi:lipid II:glycine glycyltransferase (peptidoglycan interpeptide bridge formation enzyme)
MTSEFISHIDEITEAEWSELLPRFDDASVYQSWPYGAVCWGGSKLSHLVLKQTSDIVAMAQVRIMRLPVLGKGIAYVRWGPLVHLRARAFDPNLARQMVLALKAEYSTRRGLMLRILPNMCMGDPAAEFWQCNYKELGFTLDEHVHPYRSLRVDLSQSLDDLRKGLHQRWRNYLKTAEKANYCVIEGATVDLYNTFLVLYRQMMSRKQFETTVDVEQFRKLQLALPPALRMQVFVCQRDGHPLNALVVSHVGNSAIYLLAATGDEGLKERGAHLLQWHAIQWLKSRDCRWYDLGGINPERNPGVYQFKSGLGGKEIQHLGSYEHCTDALSSLFVAGGENLRSLSREFAAVLKRRRETA